MQKKIIRFTILRHKGIWAKWHLKRLVELGTLNAVIDRGVNHMNKYFCYPFVVYKPMCHKRVDIRKTSIALRVVQEGAAMNFKSMVRGTILKHAILAVLRVMGRHGGINKEKHLRLSTVEI